MPTAKAVARMQQMPDFSFIIVPHPVTSLSVAEAEALGVQMWVANAVKQLWQLVDSQVGPDSDFTQVVEVPERWAGVQVGKKEG